jgi:hypothetical protein
MSDPRVRVVELWGGPFDGETRAIHPETNCLFYMRAQHVDSPKEWYRYEPGTGRAFYQHPAPL